MIYIQWLPVRHYASAVIAVPCVCLSLCLSVTSQCSVKMAGRIELVFGMRASFELP